ncbi:type III polyketide synthase [Stackebrandtia soli]|uniref:type III polyketide synthase n=1 Tax=Stackebrandtia soli TaxID=1892856 RepID=UPI0039EC093E
MVNAVIIGHGQATPPAMAQEELWRGHFKAASTGDGRAERIFLGAGVTTRHGAINPATDDISQWSTARRMREYERLALPLARHALTTALADAGLTADRLGLLAVVSCTGYATPGLDITLAAELGASADMQRVVIGHMGCYAAIPGLGVVADHVRRHGRPAALLCVELTSLHLQPGPLDTEQLIAHALFSDAAACVIVAPDDPRGDGLTVDAIGSRTDTAHADAMTWHVTDHGFRMGLAGRVPIVLSRHLPAAVGALLKPRDLVIDDIDAWAIHPGGRRILDTARTALAIDEDQLTVSRGVLAEHGNCSSATVLMIIDRLRRERPRELVACAFGPGLTVYSALLRREG